MDKLAAIENARSKIDRAIFQQINNFLSMRESIDNLIKEGSTEKAEELEAVFASTASQLQAIGNSVSTLTHLLVSEEGEVGEIDVQEDENGFLLQ